MKKTLVVIAGPTAIGKTELAIQVAQHYQTEILSADSRQFYKEMSIGTAKPTQEELSSASHHFINSLSVQQEYTAGQYEKDAITLLEKLFKKHEVVILTGGSGLYVNAVCYGIDKLPNAEPVLREKLEDRLEKEGIESLQQELKTLDPDYYNNADIQNPRRLIRAIEVCLSTGKPYSEQRKGEQKQRDFNIIKIGLETEREKLNKRINLRVDRMMKDGLLDEVKELIQYQQLKALQTVGYVELFAYLNEEISLEEAVEKIKVNTRRYAKRQMTWLKKEKDINWFSIEQKENILPLLQLKLK